VTENLSLRIVSLLPSATEIVCDLGLAENLVGVSHECDFPVGVEDLPVVTSSVIPKNAPSGEIDTLVREHLQSNSALYSLDLELLEELRPTLIVTQALCDVCAVSADDVEAAVCALEGRPTVVNLEPMSVEDLFTTMLEIGRKAAVAEKATERVAQLRARIAAVAERSARVQVAPRVAFLEWVDPLFNAGHWTPHLIEVAGGEDCFGNAGAPSRSRSWADLVESQPDVLCIACCGFSEPRAREDLTILEQQEGWLDLPCVREGRVYVFDGNAYFNRPGPRLVDSLEVLAHAVHPAIHPEPNFSYAGFANSSIKRASPRRSESDTRSL
jgi:iron complex transport system substrate-binding protein